MSESEKKQDSVHESDRVLLVVRLAAHVSNGFKSRIHPVVGRI